MNLYSWNEENSNDDNLIWWQDQLTSACMSLGTKVMYGVSVFWNKEEIQVNRTSQIPFKIDLLVHIFFYRKIT